MQDLKKIVFQDLSTSNKTSCYGIVFEQNQDFNVSNKTVISKLFESQVGKPNKNVQSLCYFHVKAHQSKIKSIIFNFYSISFHYKTKKKLKIEDDANEVNKK